MNQNMLSRSDELARTYQLGELLQHIGPKPFFRNWRTISVLAITLVPLTYVVISALLSGEVTDLLPLIIILACLFVFVMGLWRVFYPTLGVSLYTSGMVYLPRSSPFVARWEHIALVRTWSARGSTTLHIERTDGASIDFFSVYYDLKALQRAIESASDHSPWGQH